MQSFAKTLVVCVTAILCVVIMTLRPAQATYRSISTLKSPAAALTLNANTVTVIPGTYCSVTIWHHAADAVFWGGPLVGGASVAGVTVNATGSLAFCTDPTLCEADYVSVNVMTGGIALLSVAGTTVKYVTGEGCQP